MQIQVIDNQNRSLLQYSDTELVDFLHKHLDQFGDKKDDILKCLQYVYTKGGFIVVGTDENKIVGVVVVNETGMSGYIPENILVYIAVDQSIRGKGYGTKLMNEAIRTASGAIALHVEPDNPARKLYERLGFTNKYLEMRLVKS